MGCKWGNRCTGQGMVMICLSTALLQFISQHLEWCTDACSPLHGILHECGVLAL
jgi:hypothetical protein